jgi:hypothetical protein
MNAPWTLPQKPGSTVFDEGACSLKTLPKGSIQGVHLGAHSLNAPLGSAIRERVRGGGGAPPQHRLKQSSKLLKLETLTNPSDLLTLIL